MKKLRCAYCRSRKIECGDCGRPGFWLTRAEVGMLLDEALTVQFYPPKAKKRSRASAVALWGKLEKFYQQTSKRGAK